MRVFDSSDIRNVALIGHGHCGKTSLTSALLFTAGATDRHLKADEGNTITDFDEEEVVRKLTITSAMAGFPWQKVKINVIDTPGYNIFLNDTRSALAAADASIVLLDGVAGIEVSTEKVWSFAEEFKLPCALLVNKLDRERSSFDRVVEGVHETFGRSAVPIQLPIGSEKSFTGIIDVIRMRAYSYKPGGDGKAKEEDIPASHEEAATKAHEALVEMVAEGNDESDGRIFCHWNAARGTYCERVAAGCCRAPHRAHSLFGGFSEYRLGPADEFRRRDFSLSATASGSAGDPERQRDHKGHSPERAFLTIRVQDRGGPIRGTRHLFQSHVRSR